MSSRQASCREQTHTRRQHGGRHVWWGLEHGAGNCGGESVVLFGSCLPAVGHAETGTAEGMTCFTCFNPRRI